MATNGRWSTRRALVDALRNDDALTGIPVDRGHLGEAMQREAIWLGECHGTLKVPVRTGPDTVSYPITYDDEFTIPIHIQAAAEGQTLEEGEDRLEVLYLAVERVVRTDPQLGSTPGLVHMLLSDLVGPESFATKEGMASWCDVTLACHSRISGGAT